MKTATGLFFVAALGGCEAGHVSQPNASSSGIEPAMSSRVSLPTVPFKLKCKPARDSTMAPDFARGQFFVQIDPVARTYSLPGLSNPMSIQSMATDMIVMRDDSVVHETKREFQQYSKIEYSLQTKTLAYEHNVMGAYLSHTFFMSECEIA